MCSVLRAMLHFRQRYLAFTYNNQARHRGFEKDRSSAHNQPGISGMSSDKMLQLNKVLSERGLGSNTRKGN